MLSDSNYGTILASVSIGGFAIQQGLQIIDPLITILARILPGNADEATKKRQLMVIFSFVCGIAASAGGKIRLEISSSTPVDVLLTALVLGAGTEGVNSLQKYVGYAKEARRGPLAELGIIPAALSLSRGQSAKLACSISSEADMSIEWHVVQSGLGQITQDGVFTAGQAVGTCNVVARSRSSPGRLSSATVTIS